MKFWLDQDIRTKDLQADGDSTRAESTSARMPMNPLWRTQVDVTAPTLGWLRHFQHIAASAQIHVTYVELAVDILFESQAPVRCDADGHHRSRQVHASPRRSIGTHGHVLLRHAHSGRQEEPTRCRGLRRPTQQNGRRAWTRARRNVRTPGTPSVWVRPDRRRGDQNFGRSDPIRPPRLSRAAQPAVSPSKLDRTRRVAAAGPEPGRRRCRAAQARPKVARRS